MVCASSDTIRVSKSLKPNVTFRQKRKKVTHGLCVIRHGSFNKVIDMNGCVRQLLGLGVQQEHDSGCDDEMLCSAMDEMHSLVVSEKGYK